MPDPHLALEQAADAERKGDFERAQQAYERVLADPISLELRSTTLCRLSNLHRNRCELGRALDLASESRAVARRANSTALEAEALNAEAAVHQIRGDFARSRALLEELLALTTDNRLRGIALQNLGAIAAQSGNLGDAERFFGESYGCFMRAGFQRGELFALNNYGRAALDRGNHVLAHEVLEQAVELARSLDDGEMIALSTLNFAEALMRENELTRAEDMVSTALGYFAHTGNSWRHIECLRLLGELNARNGTVAVARRCYEDGLAIATRIGAQYEARALRSALVALG